MAVHAYNPSVQEVETEDSLGYIARPCLNKQQQKHRFIYMLASDAS
jgi:hypothetical protein